MQREGQMQRGEGPVQVTMQVGEGQREGAIEGRSRCQQQQFPFQFAETQSLRQTRQRRGLLVVLQHQVFLLGQLHGQDLNRLIEGPGGGALRHLSVIAGHDPVGGTLLVGGTAECMAVELQAKPPQSEPQPFGVFRAPFQGLRGCIHGGGNSTAARSMLSAPLTRTRTAKRACNWSWLTVRSSPGAAANRTSPVAPGMTSN